MDLCRYRTGHSNQAFFTKVDPKKRALSLKLQLIDEPRVYNWLLKLIRNTQIIAK